MAGEATRRGVTRISNDPPGGDAPFRVHPWVIEVCRDGQFASEPLPFGLAGDPVGSLAFERNGSTGQLVTAEEDRGLAAAVDLGDHPVATDLLRDVSAQVAP